ncbi:MAG: PHP-associated domain-containing protein [Candidatus Binatia bacterium]
MILDLHAHSDASEDSRAPLETYLKWLQRKRDLLPIDGLVLTEHRQWDAAADYRALEDRYGLLILRGAEVETDYGHVLVYGVTDEMARRFDFANVRLPAQEVITEVARMGGVAAPCHPGRPTIGLCEHYAAGKPPLEGVVAVEALNGGSRKGENERVGALVARYGYGAFGGSDAHLVSLIGICATEFDDAVRTVEDLVTALKGGRYRPVDFREQVRAARGAA